MKTKLKQYALRLSITVSIAALLLVLSRFYIDLHPAHVKEEMRNIGVLGPVLLLLIFAVRPYLLLPLPIIAVAAGFFFGQWLGTLLIFLGAVLGASISFFVKRRKKKRIRLDDKNMEEMEILKKSLKTMASNFY